ncbi:MAG: hypothetical protein NC090_06040 [Anaeroplasma bactoclasticum]|nr:hypothetical protein [Anaeroplasma bactoclasticum]
MNIIKSIHIEMLLWQLKLSPLIDKISAKTLKKTIKILIIIFSILLEFLGLVFILFWYLAVCFFISLAIACVVFLFIEYDTQQKTQLVQVITAILALIGVLFNIQSHDKKEYKAKKRMVYLNLIKYFGTQLDKIRDGQRIDKFLNFEEILIYSSKTVINLLADINDSSIDILSDEEIPYIIEKIAYLIDIIRIEISYFPNFIFFMNRFHQVNYIDVMDNIKRKRLRKPFSKEAINGTEEDE